MQIGDCVTGLRVTHKETGKPATVKDVNLGKDEVEIEFDNGTRVRVRPRLLEPLVGETPAAAPAGPTRPCPRCAARMPLDASSCPSCGFQYGSRQRSSVPRLVMLLILVLVLAGLVYYAWQSLQPR